MPNESVSKCSHKGVSSSGIQFKRLSLLSENNTSYAFLDGSNYLGLRIFFLTLDVL